MPLARPLRLCSGALPDEGRSNNALHYEWRSAPKLSHRKADPTVLIIESVLAIAREKKRTVKIDIIGDAREHARWRHAQRSSNHAADQYFESVLARAFTQA